MGTRLVAVLAALLVAGGAGSARSSAQVFVAAPSARLASTAPAVAPTVAPARALARTAAHQDEPDASIPPEFRVAPWTAHYPGSPDDPAVWRAARERLAQKDRAALPVQAAAGFVLTFLDASDRAPTDASSALAVLLTPTPPEVWGVDLVGPAAVARGLVRAQARPEAYGTWADALASTTSRLPSGALARFARGLALESTGDLDGGLELLLSEAQAEGPVAPIARGAAFELVRAAVASRMRLWLGAWSARDDALPEHPVRQAWPVMERLLALGEGRAAWWAWVRIDALDLTAEELEERRAALLARLADEFADAPWMDQVARSAISVATEATRSDLLALLERVGERATSDEVRAWSLFARSEIVAEVEPAEPKVAADLLERLIADHPGHELAASARPRIFALRNLCVGSQLPQFDRPDSLGRTLDLESRRGRVVALVFFEDASEQGGALGVLDQLSLLFPRDRFEVVGVSVDSDVRAAREAHAASGREWDVSWQGARNSAWPVSWDIKSFPSLFVIDAAGTIRARDVFGAELTSTVLDLLGQRGTGR
ncbi:hypothetical protein Pla163_16840 [Planctomycetes bacterium Pla163]|uniref:Thiol-disulfide oxidoreductase n=1 Tax=Rohdeia mirabilis TaxID=2528008 RepID=A0A518CZC6_9BACT|nr:hypothetical protein Pla163_16840 [Planctomycetes bacterium Pla163]